jgi:hypothetical protein
METALSAPIMPGGLHRQHRWLFSSSQPHSAPRHRADALTPLCYCHVEQAGTSLRCRRLSFHHLQLLSPPSIARHSTASRSVSDRAGAGSPPLSIRHCRIRGHARTHSSSSRRTAERESVDRDASAQTRFCAASFGRGETKLQTGAAASLRLCFTTHLASASMISMCGPKGIASRNCATWRVGIFNRR